MKDVGSMHHQANNNIDPSEFFNNRYCCNRLKFLDWLPVFGYSTLVATWRGIRDTP